MTVSEDFEHQTGPLRAELVAHCYRMTGSADEAEDLVQEIYLRAWRSYGTFEGRSSMRTWLYRIATNVCLTALERRSRRPLPAGLGPADDPAGPVAPTAPEVPWLQPFPGPAVTSATGDPAAVVASRAGLRLALIAGLQYLPGRQRAILILRDVLNCSAAETADVLGTTATAVNSALRRARAQLERVMPAEEEIAEPSDPRQRELADRYAAAFEQADLTALMAVLREDATLEMPPLPGWYSGAGPVAQFFGTQIFPSGRYLMEPAQANGQQAFACYRLEEDGVYRAHALQVLSIATGRITRIVIFLEEGLFPKLGLPETATPAAATTAR